MTDDIACRRFSYRMEERAPACASARAVVNGIAQVMPVLVWCGTGRGNELGYRQERSVTVQGIW